MSVIILINPLMKEKEKLILHRSIHSLSLADYEALSNVIQ